MTDQPQDSDSPKPQPTRGLSRRERQIIEVLFRLEQASVSEVLAAMDQAPSYSSVRALLNRMVDKRLLDYRRDGNKYLYYPITDREEAAENAIKRLIKTFFKGSPAAAVAALLGTEKDTLDEEQVAAIQQQIDAIKNNKK